ncbi:hypothetical protein PR003_g32167, partial [Phytophthora rubi]
MARWLSFFAEYNFQVEYKPERLNVVADALSRRPDYAVHKADANAIGVARTSTPSSSLLDDVRSAYTKDADAKQLLDYFAAPSDKSRQKLAKHLRARVHRYRVHNGLLLYSAVDDNADRIVVPDDHGLKLRILTNITMPRRRDIRVVRRHTCFSRVTSIGVTTPVQVGTQDKGVQHEIDLVPGTKYCVTRQWPLPREQVKAIDDFFESRRKAGQVRESKSPHSAPTFCVKKAQGGWRIVHAYNKLNDATVPAQTPIPRKDVIIDSMALGTIFSALDLRDGFYQILMRESDIPLTAV